MGFFNGNNNNQAGNPNGQPGRRKAEAQKTTPDEGKTFDKDTEFVCVTDCIFDGKRCRSGDAVTGKICPPWFIVKPQPEENKEKDEE